MIRFTKGKAPRVLASWQATPGADWESLSAADKSELRNALVRDQGALCAYCQRRIASTEERMKIEHWNARSTSKKKTIFQWSNLLGVCLGDEAKECGLRPGERHCDTSRGNAKLFLHPVEGEGPSPSEHLKYTHQGEVRPAADTQELKNAVQSDIDVLNLNARRLKKARTEIFDALKQQLERKGFSMASLNVEYRKSALRWGEVASEQADFVRYFIRRWARKNGFTLTD